MLFILKNYDPNVFFNASSILTVKYILSVNREVICINNLFKRIIKKWIILHKYIKFMKNPTNLRKREIGNLKYI